MWSISVDNGCSVGRSLRSRCGPAARPVSRARPRFAILETLDSRLSTLDSRGVKAWVHGGDADVAEGAGNSRGVSGGERGGRRCNQMCVVGVQRRCPTTVFDDGVRRRHPTTVFEDGVRRRCSKTASDVGVQRRPADPRRRRYRPFNHLTALRVTYVAGIPKAGSSTLMALFKVRSHRLPTRGLP